MKKSIQFCATFFCFVWAVNSDHESRNDELMEMIFAHTIVCHLESELKIRILSKTREFLSFVPIMKLVLLMAKPLPCYH